MPSAYTCPVCHKWVSEDSHDCPDKAVSSPKNLWGLPDVTAHEMNAFAFPDMDAVKDYLDTYIASLRGSPAWPALTKTLKFRREVTDPGMMLMLGNPKKVEHQCVAEVMNPFLPGVSFKLTHARYTGGSTFAFADLAVAEEFFKLIAAIAVMPGDTYGKILTDGCVIVNAHSRCEPGLMVHEVFHAYGGPAGFLGEGLTDWFAIDLMRAWNKPYSGNPAYGYQTSLANRLVVRAGKERVARMVFGEPSALAALKVQKPTGKFFLGKPTTTTITWSTMNTNAVVAVQKAAMAAQTSTMTAFGYTEETIKTTAPLPALMTHEAASGVNGAIHALGDFLIALMP